LTLGLDDGPRLANSSRRAGGERPLDLIFALGLLARQVLQQPQRRDIGAKLRDTGLAGETAHIVFEGVSERSGNISRSSALAVTAGAARFSSRAGSKPFWRRRGR